MSEYHFDGIDKNGKRWSFGVRDVVTTLRDARRTAAENMERRDFERVEIYEYARSVVEVVER